MPKLSTASRGLLGGIAGGIAGYGKGLQESGTAKRELYMKQFEMADRSSLEDKKHRNAMTQINTKGMLENQKPNTIAPLLKEARTLATVTDENGMETLDQGRYMQALSSFGLTDIAKRLSKEGAGGTEFDPRIWETAAARADEETDDKAGYFSTDATDFKDEGRQGFKTRRTIEIFEQLGGRGRPGGGGAGPGAKPETREARSTEGKTYPPAPREASQRTVGKAYKAPDGRLIEWTGKGWKLVGDE